MTARPLLIWQLTRRGFCSELNMLLLAYLDALSRGCDFAISSQKWNGKLRLGWRDYFEPFCREISSPALNRSFLFMPDTPRTRIRRAHRRLKLMLRERRTVLFNVDIWDRLCSRSFEAARFHIPEKGIEGNGFDACRQLVPQVWRFNAETRRAVDDLQASVEVGREPYFTLQVRRGDKRTEVHPAPLHAYLEKVQAVNTRALTRCLVMTDDYTMVEALRQARPDWRICTLCPPSERGHLQAAFNSQPATARHDALLRLLTELTLARDSAFFVGSFSSGIARSVAILRGLSHMHSVDIPFIMCPGNLLHLPPADSYGANP